MKFTKELKHLCPVKENSLPGSPYVDHLAEVYEMLYMYSIKSGTLKVKYLKLESNLASFTRSQ